MLHQRIYYVNIIVGGDYMIDLIIDILMCVLFVSFIILLISLRVIAIGSLFM